MKQVEKKANNEAQDKAGKEASAHIFYLVLNLTPHIGFIREAEDVAQGYMVGLLLSHLVLSSL